MAPNAKIRIMGIPINYELSNPSHVIVQQLQNMLDNVLDTMKEEKTFWDALLHRDKDKVSIMCMDKKYYLIANNSIYNNLADQVINALEYKVRTLPSYMEDDEEADYYDTCYYGGYYQNRFMNTVTKKPELSFYRRSG